MADSATEALRNLIAVRQEQILQVLDNDHEYRRICQEQERLEAEADRLLECFTPEEWSLLLCYDDGQNDRVYCELKAMYLQGIRDGFGLFCLPLSSLAGLTGTGESKPPVCPGLGRWLPSWPFKGYRSYHLITGPWHRRWLLSFIEGIFLRELPFRKTCC